MAKANRETSNEDFRPAQRGSIFLDAEMDASAARGIIVDDERFFVSDDYNEEKAFYDESVGIRIERQSGMNAPQWQYVAGNGKYAPMWNPDAKKWFHFFGQIPIGQVVITKRWVLEILARTKTDNFQTRIVDQPNGDRLNMLDCTVSPVAAVTVVKDSPRGHAWFESVARRYA